MTRTGTVQLAGAYAALACVIIGAVAVIPEIIAFGCIIGAAIIFWMWAKR